MTELEKFRAAKAEAATLTRFVDWLREEEIVLAERDDEGELWLVRHSTEQLFAKFFGIDLNKLEDERRALLDSLTRPTPPPASEDEDDYINNNSGV